MLTDISGIAYYQEASKIMQFIVVVKFGGDI